MTFLFLAIVIVVSLFVPFDWWQKRPSCQPDTFIARWLGTFLDVSLRNLTFRACALIFFFLAWLMFLPALLLLLLPLVAISFFLSHLCGRLFSRTYRPEMPLLGVLLIVAVIWVTAISLVAPVKTLVIAAYFLLGRPAGGKLEGFAAMGQDGAVFDLLVGSAGFAVVALWLGRDAIWRFRQASQVENLPTSRARSVALGLVELRGVARSVGEEREPILSLHWDMFDYFSPKQVLRPFYLEDATGRVLVDPTKCLVRAGWITDLASLEGCHEIVLKRRVEKNDRDDSVTRILMPGDPVYLIGNAEINPAAAPDAADSDRLVIRPSSRSSWSLSLWRFLFGKAKRAPGHSIFNVFFLADNDEVSARRLILNGFYTVSGIGFLWLASSAVIFSLALHPLSPPPESWRNAYWRGPEPNPPDPRVLLDMTGRSERLFRFEKYIKGIGPRSTDAIPALIEAAQYKDHRFHWSAAYAFGRLLPGAREEAKGAIPVLIELLRGERFDFDDRQAAMLVLGEFGPMAKDAVPSLIEWLQEGGEDILRYQAVRALGKIGPAAKDALPELNALLQDPRLGGFEGYFPEAYIGTGIPVRKRIHQAVREAVSKIENKE